MEVNYKEPPLTYALDSSGKMVNISNVERGLDCHCRCPKCNEYLEAKLGYGGRQAHFAHQKGSDCYGSYMSALHKLAEQIIEEEKAVMVPAYKEIEKQKLEFEKVEVEQRVERKDLQPDIVGVTSNGLRWFIEIRNTHKVDEAKRTKLIESNITCLEIDVREQTLENLKAFLLESTENREWINNPNYESQIVEAKRNLVSQIERFILESKELTIPIFADTGTQIIKIKEVISLPKSGDGPYARIKVLSSDEISYVFEIGSHDIIDTADNTFEHDSNELKICIDNLSHDSIFTLNDLNIEWTFHYATEKKWEKRIKEYKSNPRYEVRLKSDCYSKCEYRPFHGKCIYSEEVIHLHGVDYVVCRKVKVKKDEVPASKQDRVIPVQQYLFENPSSESLPFEKFCTIGEYYEQLLSSNLYEIEKGLKAYIIKFARINNKILLLYKEPNKVRTYYPYHIVVIFVHSGKLIRNKISDFTNQKAAMDSYYNRLNVMNSSIYTENNDNELPF